MTSKLTQKARLQAARDLIRAQRIDMPFGAAALAEFSALCGLDIRYACRRVNPTFPKDEHHVHVIAFDWEAPRQFSWNAAIKIASARDPEEARRARLRQHQLMALRAAIREDMQGFRATCVPEEFICAGCGCDDANELTVDHKGTPFIEIAISFITLHPNLHLIKSNKGTSRELADNEMRLRWLIYHRMRAEYQLLCRVCNSAKGAG